MAEAPVEAPVRRPLLPDAGRLVVIALFTLSAVAAAGRLRTALDGGAPPPHLWPSIATTLLTGTFCVLVLLAYLRRSPALATDRHPAVWLGAPLATGLPFVTAALPTSPVGTAQAVVAAALVLAGTAWSVWSVRHLSTCLSVLPQARALVDTGPYRLVRHPLYLGEVVAVAGFAVQGGHWSHGAVATSLLTLQLYRAGREERLLAAHVPGYAGYRARTWRIVPGLA